MPGNDSELAMMGLVLAIMILIFAMVWFVFMLPMEKGLHKRRMELLQRKLDVKIKITDAFVLNKVLKEMDKYLTPEEAAAIAAPEGGRVSHAEVMASLGLAHDGNGSEVG